MENNTTYRRRTKLGEEPIELQRARLFDEPITTRPSGQEPARNQIGQVDLRNIFFYRDFHRCMSRYWKGQCSAAAYSVLDMIFDRTIGWGKLWEWISLRQFEEGVWNDRRVFSDGTRLSKRTVQRALKELLEIGMIYCKGNPGRAAKYAINLLWQPQEFKYLNGTRAFSPTGSKSYWEAVASGQARTIVTLIQRIGEELYERELIDETESEIL